MQSQSLRYFLVGIGLALATALAQPGTSLAAEKDQDSDNATARRQAMYEWYTDDYSHHGEEGFTNQKQMYFPAEYEHFLNRIVRSERARSAALLPGAPKSKSALTQAQTSGTWTNIGPDRADFAKNGGTLNVSDSGRVNSIVVDPNNTNIIFIAFSGGGVWKSTDGGANWAPKTETLGSLSVGTIEMDPANSSTLYLGLGDPFDGTGIGLVKSTDGGDSWSDPVYLGDSSVIPDIEVAHSNAQVVLAATNAGLYRSTNGGASFGKVSIATGGSGDPYVWTIAWGGGDVYVLTLEAAPENTGTGTSTDGQVWRSTDNGANWTKATGISDTNGIDRLSVAAAPSNRQVMYVEAANQNGSNDLANLFKSTNNGATWVGIGKSGNTYKQYTNANSESTRLDSLLNGQGWYNQLVLVDPSNENIAYFGGALLLAKTSNGGTSFSQTSNWLAQFGLPYVHADFHGGTITAGGTIYVGSDGGIFKSTNGGAAFSYTLNKGIASMLVYQVGSSPNNPNAVNVGLQDNGTRVRDGSTATFNQIIGGDGFGCDVNQGNANKMLGSLYYADIYRSTNGGSSFSEACTGLTECGEADNAPFRTVLSRWAGDATGNTVFTFSNTKIYKTTNYATSWTALGVAGLPTSGLYLRGVAGAKTSASIVGAIANGGRVFRSTNGGGAWTMIGSPTNMTNNGLSLSSIAFDPTNASIIYVASVAPSLTASHIWRSANGGTNWTVIDGAGSGFPSGVPVNAVIVDPVTPTTLYAATQLGVYVSSDSGGSWNRFGAGMPLVNVMDVYVSDDGSLIRAATFGRSVWQFAPGPTQYTISGSVAGLTNANTVGLTLTDTTTSATQVLGTQGNGSFTFATALDAGDGWSVSVSTQPVGQMCAVSNGSGTNLSADVSNVTVTCTTNTYTLSYSADANGTLSGNLNQTGVPYGGNGTAVTAQANTGYHFVQWSDGVTTATRTDTDVAANISVTATFAVNVLVFTTQPADVARGNALGTIAVTEQDGNGNTISDNATVDFSIASVCGALDLGAVQMSGGVATLNSSQVFNTLHSGYRITAQIANPSASPIAAVDSASFNVTDPDGIFSSDFEACQP